MVSGILCLVFAAAAPLPRLAPHLLLSDEYLAVGTRHAYELPAEPDPADAAARQKIEEDYAGDLSTAHSKYEEGMQQIENGEQQNGGAVDQPARDQALTDLEKSTSDASDTRDKEYSERYIQDDRALQDNPDLRPEEDGPYQVADIEPSGNGGCEAVTFIQPYPAYFLPCPIFYASWGVRLGWPVFLQKRHHWHDHWLSIGCPAFAPLVTFRGRLFQFTAPVRLDVIRDHRSWVGGRPPRITSAQRSFIARNQERAAHSGGFSGSEPTSVRSESRARSAADSYDHSGRRTGGVPYGRTGSGAHMGGASYRQGGSTYRPNSSGSRPGGSFSRPSSSRPGSSRPSYSAPRSSAPRAAGSISRPSAARPSAARPSATRPSTARPSSTAPSPRPKH